MLRRATINLTVLRMKAVPRATLKKGNPLGKKTPATAKVAAHRSAKQDAPWWKPFMIGGGMVVALNVVYLVFSGVGTWRQRRRLEDTHTLLTEDVEKQLRERPDLAVVVVRMTAHNLLSRASTSFGAPMVSPAHCKTEAEELAALVNRWHADFPTVSTPDLWALLSSKALMTLGGPRVPMTAGREQEGQLATTANEALATTTSSGEKPAHAAIVTISPSYVPERCGDVRQLKRVLSEEGLSLEQMVALLGVVRSLGPHEEDVSPTRHKHQSAKLQASQLLLPHQCTTDPQAYSNEYFQLLLNQTWKEEVGISGYYRCRVSTEKKDHPEAGPDLQKARSTRLLGKSEVTDPCSMVAMKPLDLLLLKDPGTKAFVQRFSQNQSRLDYVVANLFDSIHQRGHNVNQIYEVS